jgi:iron complex outermembrane receptor protein
MKRSMTALLLLLLCSFLCADEQHTIEVYGKKIPFLYDSQRDVMIIKGEFLEQFPSITLAELLSFAANMNFVSRGYFQADPQAVGFNQEQVLVMVNGVPINNAQTGHHNFSLPFEASQVEQIEIARGSFSSLHGFSGTGGVVNFVISRQNTIEFTRSSFDTTRAALNWSHKSFSLSSGAMFTDGHIQGIDGKKYYVRGQLTVPFDKSYLDIWGGWILSKFGAFNFYAPYPSFENLNRFIGSAQWHWEIIPDSILSFKANSQYTVDEYKLYRDDPQLYLNDHKTLQNSFETTFKKTYSDWNYLLGFSAYADSINSAGIRGGVPVDALGNHRRSMYSLFAEASGEVGRFYLSSGVRATLGTYYDWCGQALLGYTLNSSLKLTNSFYRGFRFPTYTELYYQDPIHFSNPDLSPETNFGYSLSIDYNSPGIEAGLRLFINRSSNLIDWKWEIEDRIWRAENLNKGIHRGVDLSFAYGTTNSLLKVIYTFQSTSFDDNPLLKSLKYHYYFPAHSFAAFFSQKLGFLSCSFAFKWERERGVGTNRYYLNAKVNKTFGKVDVYLEGRNLLNTTVEKIPGLPESPRGFSLGIKYLF